MNPDPGWFSGYWTSMDHLTQKIKNTKNYIENSFNVILNIFHRSGPRAPDPETGSTSLVIITVADPDPLGSVSYSAKTHGKFTLYISERNFFCSGSVKHFVNRAHNLKLNFGTKNYIAITLSKFCSLIDYL